MKFNLLMVEQLEIRRQYDEVLWLQSFLRYQQDNLGPTDYLKCWGRHLVFRDEILNQRDIDIQDIRPDIKIEGSLNIFSSIPQHLISQIEDPRMKELSA
jgi:hypothetical protein